MSKQHLSRRDFLKVGAGALAGAALTPSLEQLLSAPAGAGVHEFTGRPNIIYIFADQLRACSVGSYGNNEIDTPHIDELASQGVRFANAVSTSPVCTPHRACLMTGRYPTITGVIQHGDKLPPTETCIAEVFQQNGYQTSYIGKWQLDGPTELPSADPGYVAPEDRQGFKGWLAFNAGHVYYASKYYWMQETTWRQTSAETYEPDFQTANAIRFLKRGGQRPFLLFLSIGIPHPPTTGEYLPPGGDYHFPYDPAVMTLRPNVDYPDPDYARQKYADYYGMVSNFDYNVGRIMEALNSLGLAENTIAVVSSDHGDLLGSHYAEYQVFRGKNRIEAESLDVPFILRCPSKVMSTVINDVFTTVDIMPTLLGLCGLPLPDGVMGRDFSPLLTTGNPPLQPLYGTIPSTEAALVGMWHEYEWGDWVGVRTPEYTLQCQLSTLLPTKLFHNTTDLYQMTNLIDNPDYQQIKDELYQILLAWLDYTEP